MLKRKIIIILCIIILLFILLGTFNIPKKILKIMYPLKYENFVELYSKEYNVDKFLIYAIIKSESNFNENAVSSKGAKGLMQLMDNTAKYVIKTEDVNNTSENIEKLNIENLDKDILNPDCNIRLGTKYISILINKYKSIKLAIVAYNAGSGNVDNWIKQGILEEDGSNIEQVPYKETNNYVRKIWRDYNIYKDLYNL